MRIAGLVFVPVFLVTAFAAVPRFPSDVGFAEKNAWMWTPGDAALVAVPFVQPLHDAQILPARGGMTVAYGTPSKNEGLERLDGKRFVWAPKLDGTIYANAPAHTDWDGFDPHLVGGSEWFVTERGQSAADEAKDKRTALFRNGAWIPGPLLPPDAQFALGAAVVGDTIAVPADKHMYIARLGDARFTPFPPLAGRLHVFAGVGGRFLAVTDDTTVMVDPTTGAQSPGPSFPVEKGQNVTGLSGAATPTSVVFVRHRNGTGYDTRWLVPNLIGAILLPLEIIALRRFLQKAGGKRWIAIGGVITFAVLGVLGYLVWAAERWIAHM